MRERNQRKAFLTLDETSRIILNKSIRDVAGIKELRDREQKKANKAKSEEGTYLGHFPRIFGYIPFEVFEFN